MKIFCIIRTLLSFGLIVIFANNCGYKGPLVMPQKQAVNTHANASTAKIAASTVNND